MISELDRKIISIISADLPLIDRPFQKIAFKLGISEQKLLSSIRSYSRDGTMRKFSAVLNHRKVGFKYNAMVVWDVPEISAEKAGNLISASSYVSHCYLRPRAEDWNYNLYAMIHGKTKTECLREAERIAGKIEFFDYKVLFSSKEYKKTGVKYWKLKNEA